MSMEKDPEVEYQHVNRDRDRKKTLFFEFPLQLDINHCSGLLSAYRLREPGNRSDLSSWSDVVKRRHY